MPGTPRRRCLPSCPMAMGTRRSTIVELKKPRSWMRLMTALWHIHPGEEQETKVAQLALKEGLAMEGCSRLMVSLGTPVCLVQGKSVSCLQERRRWPATQQRGAVVSSGLWGQRTHLCLLAKHVWGIPEESGPSLAFWSSSRRKWQPTPVSLPGRVHGRRSRGVSKSQTWLSNFTLTFPEEKAVPSLAAGWLVDLVGQKEENYEKVLRRALLSSPGSKESSSFKICQNTWQIKALLAEQAVLGVGIPAEPPLSTVAPCFSVLSQRTVISKSQDWIPVAVSFPALCSLVGFWGVAVLGLRCCEDFLWLWFTGFSAVVLVSEHGL